MVDDYNHFIGGVDIANQLRAQFSTQLRGVKRWRPLFYWLLDTTIVNAYIMHERQRIAKLQLAKDKVRSTHRAFRKALVSALLEPQSSTTSVQLYVTKNIVLLQIRLTRPIGIH